MNVPRVYTLAMLVAGGLAGLAATMQVLGDQSSLSPTLAGTIGFDAKGAVTGFDPFVWFVWTDGKYLPMDLTE